MGFLTIGFFPPRFGDIFLLGETARPRFGDIFLLGETARPPRRGDILPLRRGDIFLLGEETRPRRGDIFLLGGETAPPFFKADLSRRFFFFISGDEGGVDTSLFELGRNDHQSWLCGVLVLLRSFLIRRLVGS